MAETNGESSYKVIIDGKVIGEFTNPKTTVDYEPTKKKWKKIPVGKNAKIRVEFNSASNSQADQGSRKAYARGRWIALKLVPRGANKCRAGAMVCRERGADARR